MGFYRCYNAMHGLLYSTAKHWAYRWKEAEFTNYAHYMAILLSIWSLGMVWSRICHMAATMLHLHPLHRQIWDWEIYCKTKNRQKLQSQYYYTLDEHISWNFFKKLLAVLVHFNEFGHSFTFTPRPNCFLVSLKPFGFIDTTALFGMTCFKS